MNGNLVAYQALSDESNESEMFRDIPKKSLIIERYRSVRHRSVVTINVGQTYRYSLSI